MITNKLVDDCIITRTHTSQINRKGSGELFVPVPLSAFYDIDLNPYQFKLYLYLIATIGTGEDLIDTAMVSYKELVERTNISLSKVKSTIRELEELKLVSVNKRQGDDKSILSNEYTVYYPRVTYREITSRE